MKYLINRKTKEHVHCFGGFDGDEWRCVQADSEGWIKHEGRECPLPEDVRCEVKFADGGAGGNLKAGRYGWTGEPEYANISHYRPILTKKVQEPDYDPRSVSFNLLDRLKAAHEHAQQIPDLEAELREVLEGMGYGLVRRSPFTQQRHGAGE